jgi:hypothetical protein
MADESNLIEWLPAHLFSEDVKEEAPKGKALLILNQPIENWKLLQVLWDNGRSHRYACNNPLQKPELHFLEPVSKFT